MKSLTDSEVGTNWNWNREGNGLIFSRDMRKYLSKPITTNGVTAIWMGKTGREEALFILFQRVNLCVIAGIEYN